MKKRFSLIFAVTSLVGVIHVVNGKSYRRLLDPDPYHCANMGIPCGGHSFASCSEYCITNGYSYGQCEDSCCFCYQVNNDIKSSPEQWYQHLNIQLSPSVSKHTPQNNISPFQPKRPTKTQNKPQEICTTPSCIKAAEQLKRNMNANVNPCDNFYQFACGGFLQRTIIPSDQSSVTPFTTGEQQVGEQVRILMEEPVMQSDLKPFRMAKKFYKSCMNKANIEYYGVKPLTSLIKRLGGWPLLEGGKWKPEKFNWARASVALRKEGLSPDYFMSFAITPDSRDSTKRVITIGEPALGVAWNILIQGLTGNPVLKAYYKFQVDLAVLLGADRFEAEKEMLDALEFEGKLASLFVPPEQRKSHSVFYNPMTISQMQSRFPSNNWITYIQKLLPSNVKVSKNEIVIVQSPRYVENFLYLISKTPARTQANYLMWRAAASAVTYMNEEVRNIHSEFSTAILGKVQRQTRTKECIAVVSSVLGNAIGAMYVRRYFQEEAKAAAQEMVDDIGIAFMDILDEADWMDSNTKYHAKEKAVAMHSHIGYPQEHRDDGKLNAFYAKFDVSDGNYLRNVLSITRTATDYVFSRLRSPVNKTEWIAHGRNAVVNAFYQPQENSILFPAAILQGHFFDNERPRYLNYGGIGWIIGHEITHGFDKQGHQYDKHGDFREWWAPTTKSTYESKSQCFIQQYGNFVATDVQLRLNGENSLGENVADNGGIKEAYRGYQSWVKRNGPEKGLPGLDYTPNQLFWIQAANNWCSKLRPAYLKHTLTTGVHAPGEFRVLGTFANSKEFANDFQCPVNSQMNPGAKCSLW